MEPLRPAVNRGILDIVQSHTFSAGDFTLTNRGICRLNPHLAQSLVRAVEGLANVPAVIKLVRPYFIDQSTRSQQFFL
jgi:hypothetical protein